MSGPRSPVAPSWFPQNEGERSAVLQQLEAILRSPSFHNSKRNSMLLRFIVEQTLQGRADSVKERILGIEVFGRTPGYDTNSDHVARTAAGEVRKRLAQYYVDAGNADEIRIEVPPGSYLALFRRMSCNPGAPQTAAPKAPTPEREISRRPAWLRAVRMPLILPLSALLALSLILAFHGKWAAGSNSAMQRFWNPVFGGRGPVLICVGLRAGTGEGAGTNQPFQNQQPQNATQIMAAGTSLAADPLLNRVAMADLLALTRVASYAGERRALFRIGDAGSTSFSDLRLGPTVLIGVGNNGWTRRIAAGMRFDFAMRGNLPTGIIDKQSASGKTWARGADGAEYFKDYAMVSRFIDSRVEQVAVIIGGLGPHGTEVAGEFVTNPEQMKKIEAYAPPGWASKNIQLILSTEVVRGSSGPPKLEAAYFW